MPNEHINNADDTMYNLVRKDSVCTQMVTHIKERPLNVVTLRKAFIHLWEQLKKSRGTSLEKKRQFRAKKTIIST